MISKGFRMGISFLSINSNHNLNVHLVIQHLGRETKKCFPFLWWTHYWVNSFCSHKIETKLSLKKVHFLKKQPSTEINPGELSLGEYNEEWRKQKAFTDHPVCIVLPVPPLKLHLVNPGKWIMRIYSTRFQKCSICCRTAGERINVINYLTFKQYFRKPRLF